MGNGVGPLKNHFRQRLFEEQDGLCWWCKKPMSFNRTKNGSPARDFATFEHLVRRQDGGKVNSANIKLAHRTCNAKRERVAMGISPPPPPSEQGKER